MSLGSKDSNYTRGVTGILSFHQVTPGIRTTTNTVSSRINANQMKAKWRVCGERGSAKIAYTKLVHQKYLPRSFAKVSGISLQSVLLLAHHSTNCPRIALGSTNVPRLPRC